jgi:hypothetical protein
VRFAALFAWFTLALLAVVLIREPRGAEARHPMLIKTAIPKTDRVVIPWQLNSQCTVTGRNLLTRDPGRNA